MKEYSLDWVFLFHHKIRREVNVLWINGYQVYFSLHMKFPSFQKITKKQRIRILFAVAGLFGATCLFIIVTNFRGITVDAPEQTEEVEEVISFRNPFTGEIVAEEMADSRVACVMVENSADAWPLSGIEDAFLVIEAPVEGGIPRFMACFSEGTDVEKIGPVRSARPYYVSWASGFGALYAHVGGSPEALNLLAQTDDVTDLNEFWNGASFWRDGSRYAPHNSYTSSALLWAAADRLEVPLAQSPGWMYEKTSYEAGKQPCDKVSLDWGNASVYDVTWECDEEAGTYLRSQGGATMNTVSYAYTANNVIVLESEITSVDEVDRRHIVTEGMGDAKLCSQGFCHDGIWYKEGVDKPLQFFTSYPDEPFVFAPGKTWIEVVESLDNVVIGDGETSGE
jgi:Protein of unknown function (DUF3048) N-terminal domain/Protein of unknown function (DUF3048) C-terminal domain